MVARKRQREEHQQFSASTLLRRPCQATKALRLDLLLLLAKWTDRPARLLIAQWAIESK
jgi:hypothetical protein